MVKNVLFRYNFNRILFNLLWLKLSGHVEQLALYDIFAVFSFSSVYK
jgi:hypothetical protein